jgi:hypothetical protein
MAKLLPYIEQGNLYQQAHIGDGANGWPLPTAIPGTNQQEYQIPSGTPGTLQYAANLGLTQTVIKTYLCPSDGKNTQGWYQATAGYYTGNGSPNGTAVGISNYFGCGGSGSAFGPYANPTTAGPNPKYPQGGPWPFRWNNDPWANGDGIFWSCNFTRPLTLTGITDGTSNTFMIGEDIVGRDTVDINHNWVHSECEERLTNQPPNYQDNPWQWWDIGFYSYHTGGVQFAMADASVHFISNNIALGVYRALGTRAGGEVVPGSAF